MRRTPARTFRSILCPVDFSPHSRDALRYAVVTAERVGGAVTVLFVDDPLLLNASSGSAAERRRFIERARTDLTRFVEGATAALRPSPGEIALVVTTGKPADEILRAARRLRSDLIVMGTQGRSGFKKLFLGSTTEQVLRRASIPILAIPPSNR